MATVEIFKVKGLEDLKQSEDRDAIAKNFLGMEGSVNPYWLMTENLESIFKELCPVTVDFKEYSTNAVPSEILSLLHDAEEKKMFHKIQIWYDDVTPDPILVGIKNNFRIQTAAGSFHKDSKDFWNKEECEAYISEKKYRGCIPYNLTWNVKKWLIARWGDEIKPIQELAQKAKQRFLSKEKLRLTKEILKHQGELTLLDLTCDSKFAV